MPPRDMSNVRVATGNVALKDTEFALVIDRDTIVGETNKSEKRDRDGNIVGRMVNGAFVPETRGGKPVIASSHGFNSIVVEGQTLHLNLLLMPPTK